MYICMYLNILWYICIHISSPSQSRPKQQFHWYLQERGAHFQPHVSFVFWKPWVFPELFLNKLFNGKTQRTFSCLGSFFKWEPKTPCVFVFIKKTKSLSCLVYGLQKPNKSKQPLRKAKTHQRKTKITTQLEPQTKNHLCMFVFVAFLSRVSFVYNVSETTQHFSGPHLAYQQPWMRHISCIS